MSPSREKVALVHDFLVDIRGAERVFLELCRVWPEADLYTTIYDEEGTEGRFSDRRIHTSYLQRLRPSARTFRALLPLYPSAIESLDLRGYDLVVSSSSAWAHAVLCDEQAVHVTYCHNPFRYAWNDRERTLARRRDPVSRVLMRGLFRRWRQWDWIAAQRTDRYVANSRTTQARIQAYFGRRPSIVHPPVETSRFSPGPVGDHYALVLGADAAQGDRHRRRGVQPSRPPADRDRRRPGLPAAAPAGRARRSSWPGACPTPLVAEVLQGARALIMTAVEEFGIVAVESQAAGRPVIARRGGGALETVVDATTGCFWSGGPRELARAVVGVRRRARSSRRACVGNAARFDAAVFRRRMLSEVEAGDERTARGRPPSAAGPRPPIACCAPSPTVADRVAAYGLRGGDTASALGCPGPGSCSCRPLASFSWPAPTVLAFFSGGFFTEAQAWAGLVAWLLVAVGLVLRAGPAPLGRAAWVAIAGVGLLAAWTLASMAWAPIVGSAYHAGQLVVLYTGVLVAACLLLASPAVRAVGGTGARAGGGDRDRLRPLRATAPGGPALLSLGQRRGAARAAADLLERDGRAGGDRLRALRCAWPARPHRPRWMVRLAAAACAPLAVGLYLSFSRGALFACVAGLIAVLVAAPSRAQGRAVILTVVTGGLAIAAAAPLHGVTGLSGSLSVARRAGGDRAGRAGRR